MDVRRRIFEEDLKAIVDIVKFIGDRVKLEPAGRAFKGHCPFADHSGFTFYVFRAPETERWRCFGPCNAAGDVFAFVRRLGNLSHGEAVRSVAIECGLAPPKATPDPEKEARTSDLWPISDIIEPGQSLFAYGPGTRESKRQEYRRLITEGLVNRRLRQYSDGSWRPNYPESKIEYSDDRQLTAGNLAYRGRINGFKSSLPERRPVGIVVALPTTLQKHVEIEGPDGRIRIEDASRVFNAGEITWVEGEAIYKDVITNEHYPATLLGCSSMGFCLIEPVGSSPFWLAPKEPDEVGGRARPFAAYIDDVRGRSIHELSLESFFIHEAIDGNIPDSYRDVSGIQVPIEVPKYSLKRHADRIKRNHGSEIGGE